jgi:hypothetical protein
MISWPARDQLAILTFSNLFSQIINKPKEKKEETLSEDEKWKRSVRKSLFI